MNVSSVFWILAVVLTTGKEMVILYLIQNNEKQIKSGQQRVLHANIIHGCFERIITSVHRVSSGQHTAPGIQLGVDTYKDKVGY